MIISDGKNIYPTEIENIIGAHDAVTETAVVGLKHERLNQVVTKFIKAATAEVTHLDFQEVSEDLDTFCVERGPRRLQALTEVYIRRGDPEEQRRQDSQNTAPGEDI